MIFVKRTIGVLFLMVTSAVQADYDEIFEAAPVVKNLIEDYGVVSGGEGDVSVQLQRAIDDVSRLQGGYVDLDSGTYRLSGIQLKSNVHLRISHEAVLLPNIDATPEETVLFTMGGGEDRIENTSIRGVGGRFTVIVPADAGRLKFLVVQNVDNFLVENFHIEDTQSTFSSISLNAFLESPELYAMPEHGTIRNGSVTDAHYGYGLIQAQAGRFIDFENLHGVGGVTLRMETGAKEMNDKQYGGLWNISANGISCQDGHAALLMGPHSMENGLVHVSDVRSVGCAFAVKAGDGFISKKQSNTHLKRGIFARGSSVTKVHAVFGTNAQLKTKDVKYLPEQSLQYLKPKSEARGRVSRGPSVTAVQLDGDRIKVADVTYEGFVVHPPVIGVDAVLVDDVWTWMQESGLDGGDTQASANAL